MEIVTNVNCRGGHTGKAWIHRLSSLPEVDAAHPGKEAVLFEDSRSRRWVRRRTHVRQAPTNKEDSAKSADPKGPKNEVKSTEKEASAR